MNTKIWDRLAWMEKARNDAFGALPPGIAALCSPRGQPLVALCGPTQVGKSTLAVLLVGVSVEDVERIVGLLRGGREPGKSATPVPSVYQRSSDDSWHLSLGSDQKWDLSDEQVPAVITRLRKGMELGKNLGADYLRIQIPQRFFGGNLPDALPTIVDLPGVDADGAGERRAADSFVAQILPAADLIVLVSSQLRYFNEISSSRQPLLSTWLHNKERFRIIVTRVISNASVAQKLPALAAEGADMVAMLRSHYVEQLNTYRSDAGCLPPSAYPVLYPLEYGESWFQLSQERSKNAIFRCGQMAMEHTMTELKEDIQKNVGLVSRATQLFRMYALIEQSYDRKIGDMVTELGVLATKQEEPRQKRTEYGELLKVLEARCEETTQALRDLRNIKTAVERASKSLNLPRATPERSPEALRAYLDAGADHLKVSRDHCSEMIFKEWPDFSLDATLVSEAYQVQVRTIRKILNGYLAQESYGMWGFLDAQYDTDYERCWQAVARGYQEGLRNLEGQIESWATKKGKALRSTKARQEREMVCISQELGKTNEALSFLGKRIRALEKARAECEAEKVLAITNAKKIRSRMQSRYLAQYRREKRHMLRTKDGINGLARLLIMREDYERLATAERAHG